MEKWILYAFISMVFAGCTSVIAKLGLDGISGEVGLAIRTCSVFFLVLIFSFLVIPPQAVQSISYRNIAWLGLSGLTTAISWVFYYKAIKIGSVSTVALIDKGSFIVAVLLAWVVLKEELSLRVIAGSGLILAGLLVVAQK